MLWARGLVLGSIILTLGSGCAQVKLKTPVAPSDSTAVNPPHIVLLTMPHAAAVGSPVWMGLLITPGSYPIREAAIDFDGDGRADTIIAGTRYQQSFSAVHIFPRIEDIDVTVWIRDDHSLADSTTQLISIKRCLFDVTLSPRSAIAPLQASLTVRHMVPDTFLAISVDWTSDGTMDTTFVPRGDATMLWHQYSSVGPMNVHAQAQLRDTAISATDSLQALNTPPEGLLPPLVASWDGALGPVFLEPYFLDRQTPSNRLSYVVLHQSGPSTMEIRNDTLFFSPPQGPQRSGFGTIRVSDPDGGFVDAVQAYTINMSADTTRIHLGLLDIVTGERITTGIVTVDRRIYAVSPEQPFVNAMFFRAPRVSISGYEGNTCAAFSYETNELIQGDHDTTLSLRVITYTDLDTSAGEHYQFHDLNLETRDVPLPGNPSGEGIAGFNFANLSHDTIWISRQGYTGFAFAAADQQYIESTIRASLFQSLHVNQRPVIYAAGDHDSIPWQNGYGPTRDGLILITRADHFAVTTFDVNQNASLERADVLLADVTASEILRGIVSALAAPQPVVTSVRPDQSVLHPLSTLSGLSIMDRKLLAVAAEIPPGLPFDDVFRFPA
jgi:hypothetical protein